MTDQKLLELADIACATVKPPWHLRDDCRQSALLAGWRQLKSCRKHEKQASGRYLLLCMAKAVRSQLAFHGRERFTPELDHHTATAPADVDTRIDVDAMLDVLRPEDRAIVELYYWGGLSCPEIASELELSTYAVQGRLATARKQLAATK